MFGQPVGRLWNFESAEHTEALNRLLYVADQGEPFVLLLGDHGTGKSTLLRHLQSECSRFGHSALLINVAALDENAFLWHLCGGLSIAPQAEQSRCQLMAAVRDEISGRAMCGHKTIIILDDLNRAGQDLSPVIRFLAALNEQTSGGVCAIAASECSLSQQIQNLSALRVRLAPLDREDAVRFVAELLQSLQVDGDRVDSQALSTIADFGEGCPARITRLCEIVNVAMSTNPTLQMTAEVVEVLTEETLLDRAG